MEQFYTESIPDPLPPDAEPHSFRRLMVDIIETVLLSVIIFLGINAISARIRVESISMQPTLYEGDFVIVNKLAYRLGQISRGDVIVFKFPLDPEREPYIKRVIGLPGETVMVQDGRVTVDGIAVREPYINAIPRYAGVWEVPEDSVFVLGDNRNNSSDSHSWGTVPIEMIIGRAEVVYWPPSEWQVLHPSTAAAAGP